MKILFITSSFDKKGSASIRNTGLIKGLANAGCEIDVLTQYWPKYMIDESLAQHCPERVRVKRDHLKVIDTYFGKANGDSVQRENQKGVVAKAIGVIKEVLKQTYFFPDIDKEWIKDYSKEYDYSAYDLIISSSDTKTCHFIACELADKYHTPWYSYWGDPWEDDMGTKGLKKKIAKIYEKKFIDRCECVFYTSVPTLKAMKKKYPDADNLFFLRRAYLDEIRSERKISTDAVTISYCGSIYYGRNINYFLKGVNEFSAKAKNRKIVVEIYGYYPEQLASEFSSKYVHFHKPVSYSKVNEITRESDALLMVMNDSKSHQIPGKLFDYFGTDKAIVVLAADERNSVEEYIESTGRCIILHNHSINIDKLAEKITEKEYYPLGEFSPNIVAKDLLSHFEKR